MKDICPGCGQPVDRIFEERPNIAGYMEHVPGRWRCITPGCARSGISETMTLECAMAETEPDRTQGQPQES